MVRRLKLLTQEIKVKNPHFRGTSVKFDHFARKKIIRLPNRAVPRNPIAPKKMRGRSISFG